MTMVVTDLEVLETALHWINSGHTVALATVLETWGSAPRKAGAQLAIRGDGLFVGSVSGGCVEGAVVQETLALLTEEKTGLLLTFGVSTEDAWAVGLSCGGNISIWVEEAQARVLEQLIENIHNRKRIGLSLSMNQTGSSTMTVCSEWSQEPTAKSLIQPGGSAVVVYQPSPRLFVVGAVHIAQALVPMVRSIGFEVFIIDPRAIFLESERWSSVKRISDFPEEYLPERLCTNDAVVALSHNPTFDDEALYLALKARVFYVGALGSKKNHAKRCQRLQQRGLSIQEVEKIRGPVGLDIGAQTPAEIAVSIAAELIQHYRAAR